MFPVISYLQTQNSNTIYISVYTINRSLKGL